MQPNYQNYSQMQLMDLQNQYLQKLNQILDNHQNANKLYQNVNYKFNRRDRKTLVIDSGTIGTTTTFSVNLIEPLIIDKQSDIFLEHFTTFDSKINDSSDESAFLLKIEQFNIKNSSNNQFMQNVLIIPNEATSTSVSKTHKAKKLNYVCSINPTKLKKINGLITLLDGSTTIMNDGDGRFIAEFVIIPRDD